MTWRGLPASVPPPGDSRCAMRRRKPCDLKYHETSISYKQIKIVSGNRRQGTKGSLN